MVPPPGMSFNGNTYNDSDALHHRHHNGSSRDPVGTVTIRDGVSLGALRRHSQQRNKRKTDFLETLATYRLAPRPSKVRYLTQVIKTSTPLALTDLTSLLLATVLASAIVGVWPVSLSLNLATLFPFLAVVLVLVYSFFELYPGVSVTPIAELRQVVLGTVVAFAGFIGATLIDAAYFDTILLCIACGASICMIPPMRSAARRFFACFPSWAQPVLIFSDNGEGEAHYQYLRRHPRLGLRPIGIVGEPAHRTNRHSNADTGYLGPLEDAEAIAIRHSVYWAVVAMPERSPNHIRDVIERHACTIPNVLVVPDMDELSSLWTRAHDCAGLQATRLQSRLLMPLPRLLKRSLDVAAVVLGGLLCLPLVVGIAVLIRLTSSGPAFYGQERITRGGRRFRAWKFRTMVENADQVLQDYLDADLELWAEWKRDEKLRNDPRVTAIGGWLRKTSLDELPQIWNVLVGDMSLVGPRPIVTGEASRYRDSIALYMKVLPGITGLWQISGRNDTTFSERLDLDSYYVRNWSFWLDLYILTRTVKVVITGEGAY